MSTIEACQDHPTKNKTTTKWMVSYNSYNPWPTHDRWGGAALEVLLLLHRLAVERWARLHALDGDPRRLWQDEVLALDRHGRAALTRTGRG